MQAKGKGSAFAPKIRPARISRGMVTQNEDAIRRPTKPVYGDICLNYVIRYINAKKSSIGEV